MSLLARVWEASIPVILTITGLSKVLTSTLESRSLAELDPILTFLSTRQVLVLVGAIELGAAILLLKNAQPAASAVVIWLAASFLSYRGISWYYDIPDPCSCLGKASEWLSNMNPAALDNVMFIVAVYLFISGVLSFRLHARRSKNSSRNPA
jgi:hypothetical protein